MCILLPLLYYKVFVIFNAYEKQSTKNLKFKNINFFNSIYRKTVRIIALSVYVLRVKLRVHILWVCLIEWRESERFCTDEKPRIVFLVPFYA